ncbi:Schizosaccharomyces pombe specific protein [Schizosaccharomyces pombe]|uniref:Uncharacterized protein C1786.04 n=1 Tax=Schizosaccharomyces pombe (strain 972 / ATCC 24843) TaxID=284812 RepID=YKO4_SCHPO|nr:uncharacterized protein SPAC1786.04 [Schizosaccharomyces pombe]Q9C116.1 RecName: Full=Uncharacterized protein C1786.04 [Schizosaccharomyces pombe 972h-]CAC34406.1 sequence orphan [Schizosaccharomyces pombe]|eukprot:NP_594023.1 uncharacterized protein SPAC1786.04 [Schizosaccharomyces pombe]
MTRRFKVKMNQPRFYFLSLQSYVLVNWQYAICDSQDSNYKQVGGLACIYMRETLFGIHNLSVASPFMIGSLQPLVPWLIRQKWHKIDEPRQLPSTHHALPEGRWRSLTVSL